MVETSLNPSNPSAVIELLLCSQELTVEPGFKPDLHYVNVPVIILYRDFALGKF